METSVWVPSQQSGGALDQSFDSFLTGCLEVAASVSQSSRVIRTWRGVQEELPLSFPAAFNMLVE